MEDGKIINGNCWVAYFDVLGFKNGVLDFERQHGVGHLDVFVENFYKDLLKELERIGKYWPQKVFTSWSSDTFLFFTSNDSRESFCCIGQEATHFCCGAIWKSMPVRGALAIGQLYAEKQNDIFVGSALIDAHNYAEKLNWIGLVVTPDAAKKLKGTSINLSTCPVAYERYNVPIMRKEIKNGMISMRDDSKELFTARIGRYPQTENSVKQMQQTARNRYPDEYEARYKAKYENTLKFIEDTR